MMGIHHAPLFFIESITGYCRMQCGTAGESVISRENRRGMSDFILYGRYRIGLLFNLVLL